MGSVGTIAHSDASDLDIWVCYKPGLSKQSLKHLGDKCQSLTKWASQMGLEAHFFLMDSERFKKGEVAALDSEASGSAQHYLLLDEFYRTALLLAGRNPLWWFVPAGCENDYQSYADILLNKRFLRSADVIDFGHIARIPTNEFTGAGIWQLYKAIESPYKSVLKLFLLECYASEFSEGKPLSLQFKQAVYDGVHDVNELDPYVVIYRQIEHYLKGRKETKRLELLRRCFYFKVNEPLTRASRGRGKSWQRQMLEKLTLEWGWEREHLLLLDGRPKWKAQHVMAERKTVVGALTNCYRFLMDFTRKSSATAAINSEELTVLGRKLYAAFERKAGKIDWINPGISLDISESNLTIVYREREAEQGSVWTAYTQALMDTPYRPNLAIKQSRNLLELLMWCHCNEVLTHNTKVDIVSRHQDLSSLQLRQLAELLQQWLPLPLAAVEHDSFKHQANAKKLLVLINLGADPHQHLQQLGIHRLSSQGDALGYSGLRDNLVMAIDLCSVNSWNEVSSRRFEGDALLNSLIHYLQLLNTNTEAPQPQLVFKCFTPSRGAAISQRISELFTDIRECFFKNGEQANHSRYIFEMASEYFVLQFINKQPNIKRLASAQKLSEHLSLPQIEFSPIVIDRYTLQNHVLNVLGTREGDADLRVYFQTKGHVADIYILDEKGSLFTTRMPFTNTNALLQPLHRFIRAALERQSLESGNAISKFGIQTVEFFELQDHKNGLRAERAHVSTDIHKIAFFNLQAIAEPDIDGKLLFNIFCDQQEFMELDLADALYKAVANYVLSRREKKERYPCYITDLDLSQCKGVLNPQGELQTLHYLKIKAQLENKLNRALLDL
jgi:adenylate cyclase class 1